MPIVAVFSGALLATLLFPHHASWWAVSFPVALALAVSLWFVQKIIRRAPEDADENHVLHSAKDAIYGTLGFALFYLVACGALASFVKSAAPL